MSDEEYRQEGINMQLKPIKDKIKALEEWKKTEEEQHQNITKALDNFVIDAGAIGDSVYSNKLKSLENEIAKLKEKVNYLEDRYKESGGLRCLRDRGLIKKVLQKTLKKLADVGISGFIDEGLLEKLNSKQTEKKEVCEDCLYEKTFDTKICAICIPNSNKSQFKPKDSGGVDVVESSKHTCSFCGRKLILYKQEWICGHGCTKPAIRPDEKLPEFICSLELQGECGNEGSMDCLKGNSKGERFDNNVCVHGKRELEKPKTIEPEKEFEFQLVEKFIPPRGVHCENCMNNPVPELIEGFKDKLEFLRDKVLEAPILSGSVQDLRDHIHDLKDLVVKNINEYEGMLNK